VASIAAQANGNGVHAASVDDGAVPAVGELAETSDEGDFANFEISADSISNLKANGYNSLFDIQVQTFRPIRDGKDVMGKARTGTGKTLSFALPVIERLREEPRSERGRAPRCLVMAPTRELARQVSEVFSKVGPALATTCVYGGDSYERQGTAIRRGIDVLVGTPGRLLDHLERGNIKLNELRHLILDEADRMLDQGFVDDIEKVLKMVSEQAGSKPQMILFSATMPHFIRQTLDKYMPGYITVDTVGNSNNRTAVGVRHLAICCPWQARKSVLSDVVQVYSGSHGRCIVFTQTKRDANDLALDDVLRQNAQVLHGDIAQNQREQSLKAFRDGKVRCLVATDVAARGLDIPEVDLVVQCEPPKDVEAYIHRSGRTGRAGRTGICICFYQPREENMLKQVERRAGVTFERISAPQPMELAAASAKDAGRSLDDVPDKVLPYFLEAAREIIEEKGSAENALAAALAHISGVTSMATRSLLSSLDNYVTVEVLCANQIRAKGFVWNIVKRMLGEEHSEEVKGMRLRKDKMGAVFDLYVGFWGWAHCMGCGIFIGLIGLRELLRFGCTCSLEWGFCGSPVTSGLLPFLCSPSLSSLAPPTRQARQAQGSAP
jgi:ATP-dependent RNA helicase DDX21